MRGAGEQELLGHKDAAGDDDLHPRLESWRKRGSEPHRWDVGISFTRGVYVISPVNGYRQIR